MDFLLVIITLAFLLAGFVKGVLGLGLPTVAIGLLGLTMPPAQAAALLVVPSLVTNVWQFVAGPNLVPLLRRLWPMLAGVCIGTWAGAGMLTADDSGHATTALGVTLMGYAMVALAAPQLSVPPRMEPWLGPLVGILTGLVTAATGVFVIPAVPYLQALTLHKDDLVQALGLSFTVSTVALAAILARGGMFGSSAAITSLLAILPAVIGMAIGQWVRVRVRPEVFRFWFLLGLLGLGAHLARHLVL